MIFQSPGHLVLNLKRCMR